MNDSSVIGQGQCRFSVKTEAVPSTTEAVQSTTEAVPSTSEAVPLKTEAVPLKTEDVPSTSYSSSVFWLPEPLKKRRNTSNILTETLVVSARKRNKLCKEVNNGCTTEYAAIEKRLHSLEHDIGALKTDIREIKSNQQLIIAMLQTQAHKS